MGIEPLEPHPIAAGSTSVTAFVGRTLWGPLDQPVQVNSAAEFAALFGGLWNESPLSFAVWHFFENGGQTAIIARIASRDATDSTPGGAIGDADLVPPGRIRAAGGIYLLDRQPAFDLLVLPPFAWDRDPAPTTWAVAAAYCHERRAFLLIDPPAGSDGGNLDAVEAELTKLSKSLPRQSPAAQNAAYFCPRLTTDNPFTGKNQSFVPSGAIAGMMARIDANTGVWTAPAGNEAELRGASGLEQELSSTEIAALARMGANCLRVVQGSRLVVWGARTWQGAHGLSTEWTYIPVRRLALFLEKSIEEGTRWATFEPNEERLWSRIRLDVGEFLHSLFRQGAFQGQTPQQAYFVRCGLDIMTQADIDQGNLNILIGFAPLQPAEFVVISIRQVAGSRP